MKRRIKHKRKSRNSIYGLIAVTLVFFFILAYSFLHPTDQTNINQGFSYKAAIVDHLSLSQPNQNFIQTATTIMENAGFIVDYYPGKEVTVGFYRNLPTHDYGIIVLRVHSGLREGENPPLCLFTSQSYSNRKYVAEQLTASIGPAAYSSEEAKKGRLYFAITPKFVLHDMNGDFRDATIILMGCNGLTYRDMAEAFVGKGAKAYVGWDLAVSASHTDKTTTQLLKHLITEKQTIKQAVTETMREVGPDPVSGSILQYYPDSANNYAIPHIAGNLILNALQMKTTFYHRQKENGFVKDFNK